MCNYYDKYNKPSKSVAAVATVGQVIFVACFAIDIYFMAYYDTLKSTTLFTINEYCSLQSVTLCHDRRRRRAVLR